MKCYMPESKYELMVPDWYYENRERDTDTQNPQTFNELIQWTKVLMLQKRKADLQTNML